MGQVDDFLATHSLITCERYRIKMTPGACIEYQDRNPDVCGRCAEYRGGGSLRRSNPGCVRKIYEEVFMKGVKDLFVKPEPRREITKVQAQVTTETKERIVRIAGDTGYSIEKVCEALIMEGLMAYEAAAVEKK